MVRTLLLLVLSLAMVGCPAADDVTPGADSGGGGGGGGGGEADLTTGEPELPPAPECPGLPDLTDRAYRVTKLHAQDPTDKMNEVWDADIGKCDLVIVFHVIEHDTVNNTLKLEVTSAKAEKTLDEKNKCIPTKYNYMLQPTPFDAWLEGCRIRWSQPIELDIVTATISKPFHVFGITGFVDISSDGKQITNSWLSGAILEETAFDLCLTIPGMGVANFHWFMNLVHICATTDFDKDGTPESYKFSGVLEGEDETELFDPAIIPFETDIECEPHTEACKP